MTDAGPTWTQLNDMALGAHVRRLVNAGRPLFIYRTPAAEEGPQAVFAWSSKTGSVEFTHSPASASFNMEALVANGGTDLDHVIEVLAREALRP